MKRIEYFFLLFAGILSIGTCQAQWKMEKCQTKNNLNAISFINLNSGWIVGDNGTFLYRSGSEWREAQKFTNENLNSVFMINEKDGWAVGDNGTIAHYNGDYWKSYDSPTKNDLFSVSFQDSEKGIAVGDFGTILIFKNGIWSLSETGIRGNLFSTFYCKDEAWIGGGLECINVPLIKMGINKNENLIINSFDTYATIKSLFFLSPDDGWATGSPSILLHYDGKKWETATTGEDFSSLNSIFFSDENNGISVGYRGMVLTRSNYLWTKEKVVTIQNLNGATIVNNNYFAVGDSGTIIHMDVALSNNVDDIIQNQGKIQVYPNPCDEFLNIVLPGDYEASVVSMSIFNLLGEIIMQKELRLSNRSVTYPLITRELKNGFYMIRTTIGDKTTIEKILIRH